MLDDSCPASRLPGLVNDRCGNNRRLRSDDVRNRLHNPRRKAEAAYSVIVAVMVSRWRPVVSTMMMVGRFRHVVHRGVSAMTARTGSGTSVCGCGYCEGANEGEEEFLVVHITPDFLF